MKLIVIGLFCGFGLLSEPEETTGVGEGDTAGDIVGVGVAVGGGVEDDVPEVGSHTAVIVMSTVAINGPSMPVPSSNAQPTKSYPASEGLGGKLSK